MRTIDELKLLQALPLDVKIFKTQQRIREWVNFFGEDGVYVSFSGGKDSTVLLDIVRNIYPDIEAVFVNTGLEYPEIQSFVRTFDNVTILRPKIRFDEVISKYGYPFISKEVSGLVYNFRNYPNGYASSRFDKNSDYCKKYGDRFCCEKWLGLLDLDFHLSNMCCKHIKKSPLFDFEKKFLKKPFIASLAEESQLRQSAWLKSGCNAFDNKRNISTPLSFWTEQDILQYIKEYRLPIASVYGDIVILNKYDGFKYSDTLCDCGQKLCTTGCNRQGCMFCGYGAHLDKGESRFQRLKRTHPRQYEYCMGGGAYDSDGFWRPDKIGLGMAHCIDVLNSIYGKDFIKY